MAGYIDPPDITMPDTTYVWQTTITPGTIIKDDFYYSIESTYNTVTENHCPSNYSGYNRTVYSNKSDNSGVTFCSSNYATNKAGNYVTNK